MPDLEQMQIIADRLNAEILITGIILEMREDPWQYATINPKIIMEIPSEMAIVERPLDDLSSSPRYRLYENHALRHNSLNCRVKPANGQEIINLW